MRPGSNGGAISGRRATTSVAAWLVCVLAAVFAAAGLAYGAGNQQGSGTYASAIVAVSFPVVGALVVTHRPRNPLGWIFCGIGITQSLASFGHEYGVHALETGGPGGPEAIWLAQWVWAPGVGLLGAGFAGMVVCVAVGLAALALRFRSSRGTERQQLKWLLFGCALTAPVLLISEQPGLERLHLLLLPLVASIPVAAGIAILRHHLLDIDRVITRAIGYGLVSAVLGLGYAGIVLAAGQVSGQVSGGITGDPPGWAVAAATLTGAALFRPVLRRIQALVDRRFDRRGYDASRTIMAFSGRLRDQLDLDTLSAELLTIVETTMQPSSAGIWLKPPPVGAAQGGRGLG